MTSTVPAAAADRRAEAECKDARFRAEEASHNASAYRGRGKAENGIAAVTAGDFFFSPTCVAGLAAGPQQAAKGPAMLSIKNDSRTTHNVTIPVLKIDRDIPPGQTVSVPLRVAGPNLAYFCKFHRSSGMVGLLVP